MRPTVATLALALTLGACTGETSPSGSGDSPFQADRIILELRSDDEAPIGLLSHGGADQAGELGTHCWATQCVDFIGPPTPKEFIEVPGDGEIELLGDGTVESLTVGGEPEEEFGQPVNEREVTVQGDRARLDLEPGRYVLVAFARWSEGDAVFSFGLDVD